MPSSRKVNGKIVSHSNKKQVWGFFNFYFFLVSDKLPLLFCSPFAFPTQEVGNEELTSPQVWKIENFADFTNCLAKMNWQYF